MKRALGWAAVAVLAVAWGGTAGIARAGGFDRPDLLNLYMTWFTDTRDSSNFMQAWVRGVGGINRAHGSVRRTGPTSGAGIGWSLLIPDKLQRDGEKVALLQRNYLSVWASAWAEGDGQTGDWTFAEGCKALVKVAGTAPDEPSLGKWTAKCREDVLELLELPQGAKDLIRDLFAGESLRVVKGKGPPSLME